ncbi:MAG: NAD-dependent dihydropyrimidine dehydrogenase subunit PreA [bacterium]|jgi:dihydropyrimidine dehydrogenase (NAD+) subunit PreA|nr:NAD-dependent dihydropyrimidine dehydrogenase subunit PreA [Caldisericota bacterium]
MTPDLSVKFCGIKFPNPYILAAAPTTDDGEMVARALEAGWAGAVLKTTSVESEPVELVYPQMGAIQVNGQKLVGMVNIDLISKRHIDQVEKDVRNLKKSFPNKVIMASIMGSRKEHWQELVFRLEEAGVDMIECSFSCPHGMPERGMGSTIGQNPELTERTARWVKEAAKRAPVMIKLTPNVTDIVPIAQAVKNSGADAVCAVNTVLGLIGVDINTFAPIPTVDGMGIYGGLSGPAIKPIALHFVSKIARNVDIPISGVGGISTWRDAVEFMLVGARTVQLCTAPMHFGFRIIDDLIDGLANYLEEKGFSSVQEIIGLALPKLTTYEHLSRTHKVKSQIDLETCIKCDLCYISCRDGGHQAISLKEDRTPLVDEEKCVGCALCPQVCPVGAISMKRVA